MAHDEASLLGSMISAGDWHHSTGLTMRRDPLIDLLHRRAWAGWIDVLVLFIVGIALSIATGDAHIGNWTTNDNGVVTQHEGLSVTLLVS